MELFQVAIGNSYTNKADIQNFGQEKKYTVSNYQNLGLDKIVSMVGDQGYTFIPSILKGGMKKENFTATQIFMLDFDGTDKHGKGRDIAFDSILQRADNLGIPICFAYKTLSCTDTEPYYKYRVGFIHEFPISDMVVADYVYKVLRKIFSECDPACTELARMFLGGKGLLYYNPNARFDLVQLTYSLYKCLDNNNHFVRNIKSFSKDISIALINDRIAIEKTNNMSIFGDNQDSEIITLIAENGLSPISYIRRNRLHQIPTCRNRSISEMHNLDIKTGICKLLDDFLAGVELSHDQRFLIELNLNCIKGGMDIFNKTLQAFYTEDTVKKWKIDQKYISGYKPVSCNSISCPYYEECTKYSSCKNIIHKLLSDKSVVIEEEQKLESLDVAVDQLKENLCKAYNSKEMGFHLIKAQTALGKTTQIIKLILEHPGVRFLIAEPLNIMKRQLLEDLRSAGIKAVATASVRETSFLKEEQVQRYMDLHQQGKHKEAKQIIVDELEKTKEEHPEYEAKILELESILQGMEGCKDSLVVVTTHAMLVNINQKILSTFDAVIIDEDILYLQLLSNTKQISKATLLNLCNNSNDEIYRSIAAEMLKATPGKYYKSNWKYPFHKEEKVIEIEEWDDFEDTSADMIGGEDDNINDLTSAGAYVCIEGIYHYICIQDMVPAKYIVLSATINAEIYRAYFGAHMSITEYTEINAPYKGELTQFVYFSLGRKMLCDKQYIYDFIKTNCPVDDIISFKSEERKHDLNKEKIHFGNAIGVNSMKGHNIAIVGTPYKNPISYLLPCCYLFGEVAVSNTRMVRRRVSYKGKNFLLMAFDNELVREYEMYSLESEIEQCVGRGRLLREPCKVYLFSSFPADQAKIETTNYLLEYEIKDDQQTA